MHKDETVVVKSGDGEERNARKASTFKTIASEFVLNPKVAN